MNEQLIRSIEQLSAVTSMLEVALLNGLPDIHLIGELRCIKKSLRQAVDHQTAEQEDTKRKKSQGITAESVE